MARKLQHQFMTVSDLNTEHYSVAWYWRLAAFLASWMILGGYLIWPPLFLDQAKSALRCDARVLIVLVVTLLVAGYSLTVLLYCAIKPIIFRSTFILMPALASSALGFLTVWYNLLVYTTFRWNHASGIAVASSGTMTLAYAIGLVHTNRRIARLRIQLGSRTNNMWQQSSSYYDNWLANMFPSVKRVPPYQRPPWEQPHGVPTEDDLVNKQMAMLLKNRDPGPSPDTSQSTFRIQMPYSEGSDGETDINASRYRDVRRQGHPQHCLIPASPPRTLHEDHANNRPRSESYANTLSSAGSRGRTAARRGSSAARAQSREERRQEIELGPR